MDSIDAVTQAIIRIGNATGWQLVGAVTAAGTISMALLQVLKDLTPIRRAFQRSWIMHWIGAHADSYNKNRGTDRRGLPEASADKAQDLLIALATGGDGRAFYELSIEQMVAQMNAAVQITLDYPKPYSDLLVVMSAGADIADVAAVIAQSPAATRAKKRLRPANIWTRAPACLTASNAISMPSKFRSAAAGDSLCS